MQATANQPTMAAQIWEASKLVGPFVTALVGGWLGGRVALNRFKRERAFERRVGWYEQVCRETEKFRQQLLRYGAWLMNAFEEADNEKKQLIALGMVLDSLYAEANLYGSRRTVAVLSGVITEMNQLAKAMRNGAPSQEYIGSFASALALVMGKVAAELRAELGMPSLGDSPIEIEALELPKSP